MGMVLTAPDGRYLYINGGTWADILTAAAQESWVPEGTVLTDDDGMPIWDWPGDYFSACGQYLISSDAASLRAALIEVLKYLPTAEHVRKKLEKARSDPHSPKETWNEEMTDLEWRSLRPFEQLVGREPQVRELIAFLEAGVCRIR